MSIPEPEASNHSVRRPVTRLLFKISACLLLAGIFGGVVFSSRAAGGMLLLGMLLLVAACIGILVEVPVVDSGRRRHD